VSRLPIRLRITLAFAVAMAAVLGAIGLLVYLRVGNALLASVDQTLQAQAREAARRATDERGLVDPDVGAGVTLAQRYDTAGRPVRSTPRLASPLLPAATAARAARGDTVSTTISLRRPGGEWRVLAVPLASGRGAVAVARSLEPREETLHRLFSELLIAGPLALLLASMAGYGLAAAALRPVEAMRRRAAAVTASTPGRLPVPRGRDEVSRLAVTLNDMLARLEASFEHERRFLADASHELRTPLALLRTELELALRRPRSRDELEQALRSAGEETERLSRLADDLLLMARADQGELPVRRRRVEAAELLEAVARRFEARAHEIGRAVVAEPSSAEVDVDPDRVHQALSNLVDNALAYGAGDVTLSARERGGEVELHVGDRGPGFPSGFASRAFDRFSRADEARRRGGAGLGLAIVQLVAEAHGGTARAGARAGGGADVWLAMPRAGGGTSQRRHTNGSGTSHLGVRPSRA
jgi:signal transduction histidine kinase